MYFVRLFSSLLLSLSLSGNALAQQRIRFEHLTVTDGLPENSVHTMIQDHLGFIWLGTQNGLVRYDGTTMTVFQYDAKSKYSLKDREVKELYEDHNGDIWVGCRTLFRFERATGRFIDYSSKSPDPINDNDNIAFIHEDKRGYIWTITHVKFQNEFVLNRLAPATNTWTYFRNKPTFTNKLLGNSIYNDPGNGSRSFAFWEDRTGKIWITTHSETGNILQWFDSVSDRFIPFTPRATPKGSIDFEKITFMTEDNRGCLYLSTDGEGLLRLNTQTGQVVQFKHNLLDPHSLQCNELTKVHQSRDGFVWVPTSQGIDRLNPKTGRFTHFTADPGNPNSPSQGLLKFLYELPNGDLWFTCPGGLNFYHKQSNKFIRYQNTPTDEDGLWLLSNISSFLVDRTGLVWVGSLEVGLNKQSRTTKFPQLTSIPNQPNVIIKSIYESSSDPSVLWLGTTQGLTKLDKKTGTYTHYKYDSHDTGSLNKGSVLAINEDRQGQLWVVTQGGGLNLMDKETGRFRRFTHSPNQPNSLMDNKINALLPVSDGSLWLGTASGLDHFNVNQHTFTHYYKVDTNYTSDLYRRIEHLTVPQRRIAAIIHPDVTTNKTKVFILTQPTDLLIVAGGVLNFTDKQDYGWLEDERGKLIWEMTYANSRGDGLRDSRIQIDVIRLAAGRYRLHYKSDSQHVYGNWVNPLIYHPRLWGIQLLHLHSDEAELISQLAHKKQVAGLSDNEIFTLKEDAQKNIWIGTNDGGLSVVNPFTGGFKTYRNTLKGPLSVYALLADAKLGHFWVGDYVFGLLLLDKNGRISKRYTTADGLPSNSIFAIQRDNSGNLWIGTNNGLSRFDPKTERFHNYTNRNGLSDLVITSSFKTSDGKLYFGTAKGMNAFYPSQITSDPFAPTVVVTDLAIAGKVAAFQKGHRPIHISDVRQLTLHHNQNTLTYHFAALQYDKGQECQYAYKLTPVDKGWISGGTARLARYNNLRPGEYVFSVKAANADGVWNQKGVSIRVRILPPWWQTWWAYLCYALLLGVSLWIFVRYRSRSLRRQNRRLEETVALRTQQLEQKSTDLQQSLITLKATQTQLVQKEKMASLGELTAGVAHEIQNPLNLVNNFSEVSAELAEELTSELDKGDTKEAKIIFEIIRQNLRKIHHHGVRASSIVKDMLEHSRTESGESRPINLNALAEEYFKIAYHGLRAKEKTFNCALITNFDPTVGLVDIIPQEISRVLLNLYNNAFYAVRERQQQTDSAYRPTVEVVTAKTKDGIQIRVSDNGTGIPESVQAKIFQPFFTTKPTGKGTGLGLSLSYDIITKGHGGKLSVTSQPGQGTEFVVSLPNHHVS